MTIDEARALLQNAIKQVESHGFFIDDVVADRSLMHVVRISVDPPLVEKASVNLRSYLAEPSHGHHT